MVEHTAVNRGVVGSSPTWGVESEALVTASERAGSRILNLHSEEIMWSCGDVLVG